MGVLVLLVVVIIRDGQSSPIGQTGPCCEACTLPLTKYISVDHGFGHAPFCGETCIDPKDFWKYKIFESNLTISTVEHPCAHQYTPDGRFYSVYNSTVTHGVPGVFSVTLDLYAPGPTEL